MPSTTRDKRGDIVLVSFPFTDISSSKRRPVLVVSHSTLVLRKSFDGAGFQAALDCMISRLTFARQNGGAAAPGTEK